MAPFGDGRWNPERCLTLTFLSSRKPDIPKASLHTPCATALSPCIWISDYLTSDAKFK